MPSPDPGGMSDAEWDRHQAIIARFESAWARGERPRLGDYLPDDEPRRDELLVELVHADLEFRLKAGVSARVEDYLRKHPSLARRRETVLDLIRAEWTIRLRREPGLTLARYRRRFPELMAELGVAPGDDPDGPPTPKPAPSGSSIRTSPAEGSALPRRLGKFELREKLGVGSSGVVYRAWDTVLNREVAVKLPRLEGASLGLDPRLFLRDARHSLRLKHPNIVEILDAGPIDGVECMVRAYIEGQTLADRLREGPMPLREAASLVATVAEAVDHAHRRQVIHRDIKPSNILVDRQGRPYVMDFGLAKHDASDSTFSAGGPAAAVVGTPAYMSPEQARGDGRGVDARSDVFSLGVVLYELLTGSLPFRGRGRMLQIQIEEADPIPPRSLNDEVPAGLEAICLKALARRPSGRYPTAKALADDLVRFLRGEPPGDRPPSPRRSARASRRWPSLRVVPVAAGTLLLVALAATAAGWLRAESRRARDAEGVERAHRRLLELARSEEGGAGAGEVRGRAWAALADLDSTLDGDPALDQVAADVRLGLARQASAEGAEATAGRRWDRAILACEASLRAGPPPAGRVEDLAGGLAIRAEIARRVGEAPKARALLVRSVAIRERAVGELSRRADEAFDDLGAQLDLAEMLLGLSEARRALGEPTDVQRVEVIAREVALMRPPEVPASRWRLAGLMLGLSRRQLADGDLRSAEGSAAKARSLGRDSPSLVARSCLALARARRDLKPGPEAFEGFREAARRFEALAGPGPGRPDDRRGLGEAEFEAGCLLDRPGRRDAAVERYRAAIRVRIALGRDYPGSAADLAALGEVRLALGRALDAEGRRALALASLVPAALDQAQAVALAPGEAPYRRTLNAILGEVARAFRHARMDWARSIPRAPGAVDLRAFSRATRRRAGASP